MSAATHILTIPASQRECWLGEQQALACTGWTDRWLRAQARLGNIIYRESSRTAANGRALREYLASSLPARTPLALVPAQPQPTALEPLPLFANVPAALERVALLNPADQAQAEQRLTILEPLLDYKLRPEWYLALRLSDGRTVSSHSRLVEYVAATNNLSIRTLRSWIARYEEGGMAALADQQRRDKNQSRWFAAHPKAAYLAAYLFLQEQMSRRAVYEAILREHELLGIAQGDLPTYETVRSWLNATPTALQVYAREGRKSYHDRIRPYLKRSYVDVAANRIWVADHMIHDVEVMNDWFNDAPMGAPIRLRLSAIIDYRSRYVVGATWCWEGSSRSIAATIRRAIEAHGAPFHFYADNGKDYKRVAKGALPGYLLESPQAKAEWYMAEMLRLEQVGVLRRLDIAVTHCIAHHPQSKHVERFFRTLHERFDHNWSTYTSGSPWTRPDRTTAAMMQHRKLVRAGRAGDSKHPLASEFILACLAWIDEYNNTPHTGEGMNGLTPAQVFAEYRGEQRPAPAQHELALLLSEQVRRKVRECAVTILGRRYMPKFGDELAWARMHMLTENDVIVAYEPNLHETVAVLDLDGHYLCTLHVESKAKFAPGDEDTQKHIGESMRTGRALERATRDTLDHIARTARGNGARSPIEMMGERMALPAASMSEVTTQRSRRAKPATEPTEANTKLHSGDIADRIAARLLKGEKQ